MVHLMGCGPHDLCLKALISGGGVGGGVLVDQEPDPSYDPRNQGHPLLRNLTTRWDPLFGR